ncbi:hypothetical protein SNEBB_010862 [Seison nebaliae]|nr:hypothetical protein SNEBB_010862 [Seison nebaliae]
MENYEEKKKKKPVLGFLKLNLFNNSKRKDAKGSMFPYEYYSTPGYVNTPMRRYQPTNRNNPETNPFNDRTKYVMTQRMRGKALLIVNSPHSQNQENAESCLGNQIDKRNFETLFHQLNFLPVSYENLKATQMRTVIENYLHESSYGLAQGYPEWDAMAIMIIAPGTKNRVYGRDNRYILVSNIVYAMERALDRRPKMLFIDTTPKYFDSGLFPVKLSKTKTPFTTKSTPYDVYGDLVPANSDIFLATSGLYKSYGTVTSNHDYTGSPYLAAICRIFAENSWNIEITRLITLTNSSLKSRSAETNKGILGYVADFHSTLLKDLFLQPGYTYAYPIPRSANIPNNLEEVVNET